MKLNKMYFYRLLLNAGLFLLPLGLWYLCKGVKYGGLLMLLPEYLRITARAVFPLAMQLMGLGISLIDDRFRPFVYGSVLPMVYMGGLILYRLPHEIYRRMVRFVPYANDHFDTKWAKLKKMSEIFMKFDFLSFGAACVCLVLCRLIVVYMWKKLGKQPLLPKEWKKKDEMIAESVTHGSSKACSYEEMKRIHQKDGLPIGGLVQSEHYQAPIKLVRDIANKQNHNILRLKYSHGTVIAPSGAGKGVGVVIPTLLDYAGSVLVTDIKGENYTVTAGHRRNQGKKVYALDPFGITDGISSASFNVMDILDINDRSIIRNSMTIANLLCPSPPGGNKNAQFFARRAASFVQCLILHVMYSEKFPKAKKNLCTVYDLMSQSEDNLHKLLKTITKDTHQVFGTASRLANRVVGTAKEELSGVLNTACDQFVFLESPEIREATEQSSFNMQEIVLGKADLYLCIPSEDLDSQGHFLRLMVGILYLLMQKSRGKRGKLPLLMLIDEMPALGNMPQLEKALTYGRGYGVRLLAFSQTIEALKQAYPTYWRTFLSTEMCIFFTSREEAEAEYVSKRLGEQTVLSKSKSEGSSQSVQEQQKFAQTSSSSSEQEGSSETETHRALLKPSEVQRLSKEVLIAFIDGQSPLFLQRINYLTYSHYKGKYQDNTLHVEN